MIVRLSLLAKIACCLTGMVFLTPAFGQSDGGGLKLGQPDSTSTLNLGTADKTAPPPARPTSSGNGTGGALKRAQHGDWDVACDPNGGNCAMAQIGNDSTGTPVLEVVIRKLAAPLEVGERTATAVLDVITPLGVVLTEGLSITIDNGPKESAPFQICTEQGCLVREPVDDDLIKRLKLGGSALVSVIAANQGEVKAKLSLSGFTKAYNSLK
ncbi:invasion associated locus B family protein [Granulosicoccus sp.]|nr:invasion associated locus B family protein [Granulosicoccus sp.]MDB4222286.1 invasion associated locus B family protein [Granulosicoccus sp.]